jgi:hypothetical protein
MIVKKTSASGTNWIVWHRAMSPNTQSTLRLNLTDASDNAYSAYVFGNNTTTVDPTSTQLTVGYLAAAESAGISVNQSGATYVAYLFAHDAGGFGLTGTDNVISCGSYTGTGAAGNFVSLGYEPQWLLIKRTNTTGNWLVLDTMRGIATGGVDAGLFPNLSNAEDSANEYLSVNATGFELTGVSTTVNASGSTYIYIAIRRGPRKVPTDGASVFAPVARTGDGTGGNPSAVTTGIVTDMAMVANRTSNVSKFNTVVRLTNNQFLRTALTNAEAGSLPAFPTSTFDLQNGFFVGNDSDSATLTNGNGSTYINYAFQRAPSFMDVVCYTGSNTDNTLKPHNLGVKPEMIIVKTRSSPGSPYDNWFTWTKDITEDKYLYLNTTDAEITASNPTFGPFGTYAQMTTTGWYIQNAGLIDRAGDTYTSYLFATCPGVSKVGSFTGTGATQVIDCGFTGGARFVMIKARSTTGDWYVWDSARGIVAGNDPYSRLNSTLTEITTTDWVDTAASGFELSNAGGNLANSNGVSYIFLAIA